MFQRNRIACLCGVYRNPDQMCLNEGCCIYMKYTQGMKERGISQAETTRKSLAVLLATTLPLSAATVEASLLRLAQLLRSGTTSDLLEAGFLIHALGIKQAQCRMLIDSCSG